MDNREIDKLIAVNLFGWKKWKFQNPSRIPGQVAFEYETLVPPEYDGSNLQHLNMIIPHYSTDISAAWQVVEELHKRKDYVSFTIGHNINYETYTARYGTQIWVENIFAPMAICLAALKAVGVEVSECPRMSE